MTTIPVELACNCSLSPVDKQYQSQGHLHSFPQSTNIIAASVPAVTQDLGSSFDSRPRYMPLSITSNGQPLHPENYPELYSPQYQHIMHSDDFIMNHLSYGIREIDGQLTPYNTSPESELSFQTINTSLPTNNTYRVNTGLPVPGIYSPAPTEFDTSEENNNASYYTQNDTLIASNIAPTPSSTSDLVTTRQRRSSNRKKVSNTTQSAQYQNLSNTSPSITEPDSGITEPDRKKRKSQADNKVKHTTPKLSQPLSVLTRTKEYMDIPIKNMETWVTRTIAERKREVAGRNGYVTRPMNSFMLYRSAFSERAKRWCKHHNHQVVSAVTGASWPLETPEIRDKYNALARIERHNHQIAHPGYKFSPSKLLQQQQQQQQQQASAKIAEERAVSEETTKNSNPVSFENDLDHTDDVATSPEQPDRKRRKRNNKPVIPEPLSHEIPSLIPTFIRECSLDSVSSGGARKSSYKTLNPGRDAPTCMTTTEMNGSYYQTIVRPTATPKHGSATIEDVTIRRTPAPLIQNVDIKNTMQERLHGHRSTPAVNLSNVDPSLGQQQDNSNENEHHQTGEAEQFVMPNYYSTNPYSFDSSSYYSGGSFSGYDNFNPAFTFNPSSFNSSFTSYGSFDSQGVASHDDQTWVGPSDTVYLQGSSAPFFTYDEWLTE